MVAASSNEGEKKPQNDEKKENSTMIPKSEHVSKETIPEEIKESSKESQDLSIEAQYQKKCNEFCTNYSSFMYQMFVYAETLFRNCGAIILHHSNKELQEDSSSILKFMKVQMQINFSFYLINGLTDKTISQLFNEEKKPESIN